MRFLIGLIGAIGFAYMAIAALVYFQQSKFIYPAPQEVVPLAEGFDEVELETSDGLKLRAFFRAAKAGMPTAIFFHGNGGTLSGSVIATDRLKREGMGLLLLEYRGYGGNVGEPSEEGFYRDGRAAIAYLQRFGIHQGDIVLIGNSIGGGTATQMATEIMPKALILSSAFTSLPDVASEKMAWLPIRLLAKDKFDNRAKIGGVKAPIFIQHGLSDDLIPPHHGERLAAATTLATFQTFTGAGHELAFLTEPQSTQFYWLMALEPVSTNDQPAVN